MTQEVFRRRLLRLIPGVIATVALGVAVTVFIRSLGDLFTLLAPVFGLDSWETERYAAIFYQLKRASLNLPLVLTGVLCLPLGMLSARITRGRAAAAALPAHRAVRIAAVALLWLVLALPLFALTLWFTEVNDVLFGRVMLVLINALSNGVF